MGRGAFHLGEEEPRNRRMGRVAFHVGEAGPQNRRMGRGAFHPGEEEPRNRQVGPRPFHVARNGRRHRLTVARIADWASNSCDRPEDARSSRPSIAARSKGLPSAVPWTSTNVPASVPTTLKSTSARESSL